MRKALCVMAVVISAVMLSCNQTTQKTENTRVTAATSADTGPYTYSYQSNGDTITLALSAENGKAAGELVYLLNEKDSNRGTIKGSIRDGLLVADYTFMSEGITSVRQVAFRLTDLQAVEGYGEMEDINGKLVFKDTTSLQFLEKMPLKRIQ